MSDRDDLFDVDPPEEQDVTEGQDEDFFFDLNDEEPLEDEPQAEPAAEEPPPPPVEDEPVKEKSESRQRVLMLLLLVLVLLGAAYFYMGDQLLGPEPAPVPQVVKSQPQKLKVPERKQVQQEQKAVEEVVMPSEKVSGTPVEEESPASQQPVAAADKTAAAQDETTPEQPVEPKQAETVAKTQPVAAPIEVAKAETSKKPAAQDVPSAEKPVAAPAEPTAPYVLQIGAYVLETNLENTLDRVKGLGFEPVVTEEKKTVAMTRLRLGAYPEDIARIKLSELQQLVPDAFLLLEGDKMALYAGSYYGLEKARVQADRLYQYDVKISEETVDIAIPIKVVCFGGFPNYAAAEIIAGKAKEAGLDTLIVKRK